MASGDGDGDPIAQALESVDRLIRTGSPVHVAGEDLTPASCPRCRAIVWHCPHWTLFDLENDAGDGEPYLTVHACPDEDDPDRDGYLE